MKYQIYKPNSKNNGCAASFSMSEDKKKGGIIMFVNAIMQASWDDSKKLGSFSANAGNPEKSCAVMFNLTECGEMLAAFTHRYPKNFYHKTASGTKSVSLSPWDKEVKIKVRGEDTQVVMPCFGLNINVDGSKNFKIPLEPGEIENIKALITQGLYRNYGIVETWEGKNEIADDVKSDEQSGD
jgi:hypothetical protein